jgi:hypothetical protein
MYLASALHKYWSDRYRKQFPYPSEKGIRPGLIAELFKIPVSTTEDPPYEEPKDDRVFQELLVVHEAHCFWSRLRNSGRLWYRRA